MAAARAPIPGDLHVEHEGLGRREVGDRPMADLEGGSEFRATVSASVEGEAERWGVGLGARPSPTLVAELAPGGSRRVLADLAPIEDPARGNAPRLGGPVVGGEQMQGRLVATELLLQPTDLVAGGVPLLLHPGRRRSSSSSLRASSRESGALPSACPSSALSSWRRLTSPSLREGADHRKELTAQRNQPDGGSRR